MSASPPRKSGKSRKAKLAAMGEGLVGALICAGTREQVRQANERRRIRERQDLRASR